MIINRQFDCSIIISKCSQCQSYESMYCIECDAPDLCCETCTKSNMYGNNIHFLHNLVNIQKFIDNQQNFLEQRLIEVFSKKIRDEQYLIKYGDSCEWLLIKLKTINGKLQYNLSAKKQRFKKIKQLIASRKPIAQIMPCISTLNKLQLDNTIHDKAFSKYKSYLFEILLQQKNKGYNFITNSYLIPPLSKKKIKVEGVNFTLELEVAPNDNSIQDILGDIKQASNMRKSKYNKDLKLRLRIEQLILCLVYNRAKITKIMGNLCLINIFQSINLEKSKTYYRILMLHKKSQLKKYAIFHKLEVLRFFYKLDEN